MPIEEYDENKLKPETIGEPIAKVYMGDKMSKKGMTEEELLKELNDINETIKKVQGVDKSGYADLESTHCEADELLLKFINNKKISEAFDNIPKWYA